MTDIFGEWLTNRLLTDSTVAGKVGTRIYKRTDTIGEVQYPCVVWTRRSVGYQDPNAPYSDFDIQVTALSANADTSWELSEDVRASIDRSNGGTAARWWTVDADSTPVELIERDTETIYAVHMIYRVRQIG